MKVGENGLGLHRKDGARGLQGLVHQSQVLRLGETWAGGRELGSQAWWGIPEVQRGDHGRSSFRRAGGGELAGGACPVLTVQRGPQEDSRCRSPG